VARKLLGTSSLVHVSHSAMAPGRRVLLSRCLHQGYGGQHQSPQIELALVNAVADDLGRTRCTPSRGIVRFRNGPANHESTHDPEEDIGPRSETIVAHDLAAGPTRQPPGEGNKRNGTFPPSITTQV
jgi:hypothetical protein